MSINVNKKATILVAWAGLLVMAGAAEMQGAPKPKHLVVQFHEVKCWDETTGKVREKFGVDTMRLTAISIDPAGVVKKNKIHKLGDFAKDGVTKRFNPPRTLASFKVNNNLPFPIQYQVLLVLAEKDRKNDFESKVDVLVKQGSAAALAKAKSLGAITLEALPAAFAAGAATPEAFVAEVAKRVITAKVLHHLGDDIFPLKQQNLRVNKKDFTWPKGKMQSAEQRVIFEGKQGKYHVIYTWALK